MKGNAGMTPKDALHLAAPHTFAASVCPALFGILYSYLQGWPLAPLRATGLFVTCVLMQSAVNTLNDYSDYVKGTDTADDNVEAYDSVLVYSAATPKQVLTLGISFLAAAALIGLASVAGLSLYPVIIGVIGGAVVAMYSAGPLPISYLPFGEFISGFVMGGLIPLAITSAAAGRIHWEVLIYSFPFILGIALIMMSNNGCDIEKDIRAGRQTLPVTLGREKTAVLFHALVVIYLMSVLFLPLFKGLIGIAGYVLLLFAGREVFSYLRTCTLQPPTRISQMKHIVKANYVGGATYLLSLFMVFCWRSLHGI